MGAEVVRVASDRVEHAAAALSELHEGRLHLQSREGRFLFRETAVVDPEFTVSVLELSGATEVKTDAFTPVVVAQVARGSHRWKVGKETGALPVPFVVPPGRTMHAHQSDVRLHAISLEPRSLDATAEAMTGRIRPVSFSHHPNERRGDSRILSAALRHVAELVEHAPDALHEPLTRASLHRHLAACVLTVFGLAAAAEDRGRYVAHPETLRRALRYVDDHAQAALTLDDIAIAAGISPRTLHLLFRRERDQTPMQYLRLVRLSNAHAELLAGTPTRDRVTDIARRWGFTNAGRFAALHVSVYGTTPRETLAH